MLNRSTQLPVFLENIPFIEMTEIPLFYRTKTHPGTVSQPGGDRDYFDNGIFRTASGTVLQAKKFEKNSKEFDKILKDAEIVDTEAESKKWFLLKNFGDVDHLVFALKHGATTSIDNRDWEGEGHFSQDELSRLRDRLLRGKKARSAKEQKGDNCVIL